MHDYVGVYFFIFSFPNPPFQIIIDLISQVIWTYLLHIMDLEEST